MSSQQVDEQDSPPTRFYKLGLLQVHLVPSNQDLTQIQIIFQSPSGLFVHHQKIGVPQNQIINSRWNSKSPKSPSEVAGVAVVVAELGVLCD